jgi:hypothetical protein
MKKAILSILAAGALASSGSASVTINFGMGDAYSGTNTSTPLFPSGGLINLLALDSGTWTGTFPDLVSTFSNLTNSFTPAGVTRAAFAGADASGAFGASFVYNYSGGFNTGDELLVVAYPTLTTGSASPGLNAPGFFFRTTLIVDGSAISYTAPADGGTYDLFSYTLGQSGTFANSQFTSGAGAAAGSGTGFTGGGFTTVPEPSTYALLAMGAAALGGYVIRRRKRD